MAAVRARVEECRRPGDVVVASLHWGGNWGYETSPREVSFARRLVDEAAIDVVHGHSSHHMKAVEVHNGRLILHGCGDFLTDYEGIGGYEGYRGDLGLSYFPRLDPRRGRLRALLMTPTRLARLRINRASESEARWLVDTLNREGRRFGTSVELTVDGRISLDWPCEERAG